MLVIQTVGCYIWILQVLIHLIEMEERPKNTIFYISEIATSFSC